MIDRLLNTSSFGLAGSLLRVPADGAGTSGSGEPAVPAATPAEGESKPIGTTENVEPEPEAEKETSMFAMPTDDDALFSLDDEGEPEPAPVKSSAPPAAGETPPAGTQTEQPTPPAGTPPQATPPAAVTPPAQTVPPADGTTPPAPAAAPPPAEAPAAEQIQQPHEVFLQALEAGKAQILPDLAKQYSISDEDAEKLGIVDGSVLSGLAANLHYNVMKATTQMLLKTLAPAVTQIIEVNARTEKAISKFYEANPELSRETDHALVTQYASMYWQTTPKGTIADMYKQVGTMAKAHLGKLTAQAQTPSTQTPPAGVAPKKVPPKMQPSFTPASGQGAAPAGKAAPPKGDEIWGALGDHLARNDDD